MPHAPPAPQGQPGASEAPLPSPPRQGCFASIFPSKGPVIPVPLQFKFLPMPTQQEGSTMPRRTRRVAYSTSTAEAKAKRAQRLYKHAHEVERIHKAAQAAKAAKAAKRDLEDPPYTKAGKRTKLRDLVGTQ